MNIPSDSQRVEYPRLSSPPTYTDQTPLTDLPSHVTEQLLLRRSSRISKQPEHCDPCKRTRYMPSLAPLHPWEFTKRPWSRLHVDYTEPVNGNMLIIIVDSHTKWIDVHVTSGVHHYHYNQQTESFSTHGIPDTIVSDNATCFTSSEFQEFYKHSGIPHITSAPYHPSSNRLAERAVQTVKSGLKRTGNGNIEHNLLRFLLCIDVHNILQQACHLQNY